MAIAIKGHYSNVVRQTLCPTWFTLRNGEFFARRHRKYIIELLNYLNVTLQYNRNFREKLNLISGWYFDLEK